MTGQTRQRRPHIAHSTPRALTREREREREGGRHGDRGRGGGGEKYEAIPHSFDAPSGGGRLKNLTWLVSDFVKRKLNWERRAERAPKEQSFDLA